MIVAANKCDLIPEGSDNLERLRAYVTERGYPFYEISGRHDAGHEAAHARHCRPSARASARDGL